MASTTQNSAPPWAALPVIIAGALMVVLDFFIVNVALPSITADLHAGAASIEWIVASYAMLEAILLITCGKLGDRLGRRRLYWFGVALFTLASLACAAAPTAGFLIAARVAQGIAGAMLMPQVLAIIGVSFDGAARVKALALYSMAMGLAAAGAQLVGGALIELDVAGLGWRWCFLVNVPIGLAALVATPRLVPESRASAPGRIDVVGVLLLTAGLAAVVVPLIEGRQHAWPLWTWISFGAAVVLLGEFVARQRSRTKRRAGVIIDLALFRSGRFSAGLAAQTTFWCGQAAFFAYFALYLQAGRGLSALDAGLVFTIAAVAYVAAAAASEPIVERVGRAAPFWGGLTLAAGHGAMLLAVSEVGVGGSVAALVPGLVLIGAGMGICLTSLNAILVETFDDQRAGSASGIVATTQALGNALGVAIAGIVYFAADARGIGHAFATTAVVFTTVGLAVAALTRLLPPGGLDERAAMPGLTTIEASGDAKASAAVAGRARASLGMAEQ